MKFPVQQQQQRNESAKKGRTPQRKRRKQQKSQYQYGIAIIFKREAHKAERHISYPFDIQHSNWIYHIDEKINNGYH